VESHLQKNWVQNVIWGCNLGISLLIWGTRVESSELVDTLGLSFKFFVGLLSKPTHGQIFVSPEGVPGTPYKCWIRWTQPAVTRRSPSRVHNCTRKTTWERIGVEMSNLAPSTTTPVGQAAKVAKSQVKARQATTSHRPGGFSWRLIRTLFGPGTNDLNGDPPSQFAPDLSAFHFQGSKWRVTSPLFQDKGSRGYNFLLVAS
jgi:hypothetical protein